MKTKYTIGPLQYGLGDQQQCQNIVDILMQHSKNKLSQPLLELLTAFGKMVCLLFEKQ
jgi:Trp operon repressor